MSIQLNVANHILFEDPYILLVNKPSSLMVEPDRNNYPNLLQQVRAYIKSSQPTGQEVYAQHIHRLDRPVSGIVLFAKQKTVLKNLSEQFAERRVKKLYQALTDKAPDAKKGKLESWLRKEKKKAILYPGEVEWSEKAILTYEVKGFSKDRFLWDIELYTGKYHQIRAQLSGLGCPIIGDAVYGSELPYKPDSIALHASRLIFFHPVSNEEMVIDSKAVFEL